MTTTGYHRTILTPEQRRQAREFAEWLLMPTADRDWQELVGDPDPIVSPDGTMKARLIEPAEILRYMMAGNATITIKSLKTQTRFTFRIRKIGKDSPHFVSLLSGPDNTED